MRLLCSLMLLLVLCQLGCGNRTPDNGATSETDGVQSYSGGDSNSNEGNQTPAPSFGGGPRVPSAFTVTTFDITNGKRYGITTGNKYIITNRNEDKPDLKNVNVMLTFYPDDGTRHELKKFWAVWKRGEGKEIDVWTTLKLSKVQRIEMEGTTQLDSSIQAEGKVSASWSVQ